jgi:hypothetical protein
MLRLVRGAQRLFPVIRKLPVRLTGLSVAKSENLRLSLS